MNIDTDFWKKVVKKIILGMVLLLMYALLSKDSHNDNFPLAILIVVTAMIVKD